MFAFCFLFCYYADMSATAIPKKLTGEIKLFIVRAIEEVLSDPDFGLELTERAKRRLRQAAGSKRKNISFSEIKKKYY